METTIFVVGVVVMMMVIGGCFISTMLVFTNAAHNKKEDKS